MPPIQLFGPTCVFVSSNDEIFIADCNNHRIRKLNNQKIMTVAGNGELGFSSDGGLAINAKLNYPNGVFVVKEEVYIADYHNHRIRKVSNNGIIETIAGNGEGGFEGDNGPAINAKLNYPTSVFVSENGEVYISDYLNNRVRKVLQNGNIVTIAGNGKLGCSGDGGLAINAELNCPMNVFVFNEEVYITDSANHRIRKVSKSGIIETIAGNGNEGFSGDDGLATQAQLNCPMSTFVNSNGEIYITDSNNFRIRKVLKVE
ncbi:predicted protein [Naegleria gruberi]|uniref:Predicted protein n=1 Tax=Naegleria gruberi TaxID=5762 RepID=D2VW61_NAEGR|nr:uncharacterized protein NAEGRDRAFT_73266 [Naegleria gruberi]EFC39022.1 predicted protein [Naegleria gruberi]|eukprot:XP_002671766.1 predicted protein [Naegleria gruberi strain NEG-M]